MSKIEFINQMEPWFGLEEQEALNKYMGEGGWVTEFKKTFEFQIPKFPNSVPELRPSDGSLANC